MEYTRATWNSDQKKLRQLLKKESTFDSAISLFLEQHARIHSSDVSGIKSITFEDELWEGMDEITFRTGENKKGRTVAYGMWHSARIEDITMNLLVAGEDQVIDRGNWIEKMNSSIYDTGNALDRDQILKFSEIIDMQALRDYRKMVGRKTREIVRSLTYDDLKRKVSEEGLKKIITLRAVANDEASLWLIDFWGRKTVEGILLMPATRHHLVHINESIEAKRKGSRKRKTKR